MANHLKATFYNLRNYEAFCTATQTMMEEIKTPDGIFIGDNLLTFNSNLSFLDDKKFMAAFNAHARMDAEQASIWRVYINCWFARRAMGIDGDIVECACYRGTTARIMAEYTDFAASDKGMWLYDLFEHDETMRHHDMPMHGTELFDHVKSRFTDFPNVRVIKGEVPQILSVHAPNKIAHLHLDLNDALAELGALQFFFDRVTPGGTIVFDDYGWLAYRSQKIAEDGWLAQRGASILELPTGQGLFIR